MPCLQEIKDTFAFFDDWEDRYRYIIDLGKQLPDLDNEYRIDANLVQGCQSLVWIVVSHDATNDRMHFRLDSDAFIVRGLISIVLSVFQDHSPSHVCDLDIESIFEELDLLTHLSPTRGNGLRSMVGRIQFEANSLRSLQPDIQS